MSQSWCGQRRRCERRWRNDEILILSLRQRGKTKPDEANSGLVIRLHDMYPYLPRS